MNLWKITYSYSIRYNRNDSRTVTETGYILTNFDSISDINRELQRSVTGKSAQHRWARVEEAQYLGELINQPYVEVKPIEQ